MSFRSKLFIIISTTPDLQGCRDLLEHIKVSDEQFTDSISTIILLEGVDLCVLVQQVLDKRLGAVRRHLSSGGSVRKQLSDVSRVVFDFHLKMLFSEFKSNHEMF